MWSLRFPLAITVVSLTAFASQDPARFFTDEQSLAFVKAAIKHDGAALKRLREKGANPDAPGSNGRTPLVFAMLELDKVAYKLLLENGADPNARLLGFEASPDSVIALAAQGNDVYWLQEALAHKADPNLPSKNNGRTPLFFAVSNRRLDNIKLLLTSGANLEYQDTGGYTPLLYAALISKWDSVLLLLRSGADASKTVKGKSISDFLKKYSENPSIARDSDLWLARTAVVEWLRANNVPLPEGV